MAHQPLAISHQPLYTGYMTRQEAYQTLTLYTKSQNLIAHHFAVEAAMRALGTWIMSHSTTPVNLDDWGLVGLLHDADYELTKTHPENHTLYLEEKIGNSLSPEILYAIKSHNYRYNGIQPKSLMDWALYACDELTGFVISCALKEKNKSMNTVTVTEILAKMNDKNFAKDVDRGQILTCEKMLNIPIQEFIQIVLKSMQTIAPTLGFE